MSQIFTDKIDCKRILREVTILKAIKGLPGLVKLLEII
jgi:hypothetical protein